MSYFLYKITMGKKRTASGKEVCGVMLVYYVDIIFATF